MPVVDARDAFGQRQRAAKSGAAARSISRSASAASFSPSSPASRSAAPIEPPDSRASRARSSAEMSGRRCSQLRRQRVVVSGRSRSAGSASGWSAASRRRMRKQHQHRARRRLFQHLEKRVGGVVVHVVGGIDDRDAPAARAGGQAEEIRQLADFVDGQHRHQLAGLGIEPALQHQQARMRAGRHELRRRDRRRPRRDRPGRDRWRHSQEIARDAIGQRRLADAGRPADQPACGGRPPRMARAARASASSWPTSAQRLARMRRPAMRSLSMASSSRERWAMCNYACTVADDRSALQHACQICRCRLRRARRRRRSARSGRVLRRAIVVKELAQAAVETPHRIARSAFRELRARRPGQVLSATGTSRIKVRSGLNDLTGRRFDAPDGFASRPRPAP